MGATKKRQWHHGWHPSQRNTIPHGCLPAGVSIITKKNIGRTPSIPWVHLPSGRDGNQCASASTGAPATIYPAATGIVVDTQFVEVPETSRASGGYYTIPSIGAVVMSVVEQGMLKWRWFPSWEAVTANGWLPTMALIPDDFAGVPQGDLLPSAITFTRGPANLAAASCRPGSVIDTILLPRFGNGASSCNASSSYRWVGWVRWVAWAWVGWMGQDASASSLHRRLQCYLQAAQLPLSPLPRSVVANACLGKDYCTVAAGNAGFGGDPCPGTPKTLSFSWTCTNRVAVIEGTNCPYTTSGQFHRCSTNGMVFLTSLEGGMMKVRGIGNEAALNANLLGIGNTSPYRDITSDNADNCAMFNQCPRGADVFGTISFVKNANVAYTGAGAYASCPMGSTIGSITAAWWGCATGASATTTLSVVQAACVGQASCTVDASNTLFGDPCFGLAKTLAFTWTCT